jgi:AraC-like DNA-binding protein
MKTNTFSDQVANFIIGRNMDQLRDLTIREITEFFEVSKVYLIKKFKDEKGITPGKFILREKMIRANSLMEHDEDLTIKNIAEIAGYSSSDYFIRVFKEQMGLAPSQYRNIKKKALANQKRKHFESESKNKIVRKFSRE